MGMTVDQPAIVLTPVRVLKQASRIPVRRWPADGTERPVKGTVAPGKVTFEYLEYASMRGDAMVTVIKYRNGTKHVCVYDRLKNGKPNDDSKVYKVLIGSRSGAGTYMLFHNGTKWYDKRLNGSNEISGSSRKIRDKAIEIVEGLAKGQPGDTRLKAVLVELNGQK
jgi:hypothetical protein